MTANPCRNLILILGDQLDEDSAAFDDLDASRDVILMVEAQEESTHVWSHQARTTLFLSAMRHFADTLRERGLRVAYRALGVQDDASLGVGLVAALTEYKPERVIGVVPGDLRVRQHLDATFNSVAPHADSIRARDLKATIEWREDRHFLCSRAQFRRWAGQSSTLRMEFFYRTLRQQYKVLMSQGKPIGGQWNFDADNRKGFGKAGPQNVPRPLTFEPDAITQEVMALVKQRFSEHPGQLDTFHWPVTRAQALNALQDFIEHRLPHFGPHQDAMWTHLDFGWHALLSSSLNLKLLNPLEVVQAAEQAYHERGLDLASVEGFVRQILGWREFIRGVYDLDMPELKTANHFGHSNPLPNWYWSANTKMNCMRQCINQTLANGYSHHIQRLMITGMFGVTAQIQPQQLCD